MMSMLVGFRSQMQSCLRRSSRLMRHLNGMTKRPEELEIRSTAVSIAEDQPIKLLK